MRTCYLHVGMPKTGSTSIQIAFRSYDDGSLAYAKMRAMNHSGSVAMTFASRPDLVKIAHPLIPLAGSERDLRGVA